MPLTRTLRATDFGWPAGLARIPDEEWARSPLDEFGTRYDQVGTHRYYQKNLDPLVAQVAVAARDGQIVVDYSSGTGLLTGRIRKAVRARIGVMDVDPSAKLLRVAVENHAGDGHVAFRLLGYIKAENRLRTIGEVLGPALARRGVDILMAANAVHLYPDLQATFLSWHHVMRPHGLVMVNSGCVRNPAAREEDWLLDDTVDRINEAVADLVVREPAFAAYRGNVLDSARWSAHMRARQKVFVPVRPLQAYLDALVAAGFEVLHVMDTTIFVNLEEFAELLSTYHESALGWVGGTRRVDGAAPSEEAVWDRLFLIRYGLEMAFPGVAEFPCNWTYVTCRRKR